MSEASNTPSTPDTIHLLVERLKARCPECKKGDIPRYRPDGWGSHYHGGPGGWFPCQLNARDWEVLNGL